MLTVMGSSFSIEEAAVFSGPLLFWENAAGINKRKRESLAYAILCLVVLVGIIIPLAMFPDKIFTNTMSYRRASHYDQIPTWPGVFLLLAAALYGTIINFISMKNKTPISIHQNGFSSGEGRRPFYRASDVYTVEEDTPRGRESYILVTTVAGDYVSFPSNGILDGVLQPGVARTMRDVLFEVLGPAARPRLQWSQDAWGFVTNCEKVSGPVRASAERIAIQRGVALVDMYFLASCWFEVYRGSRGHSLDFRKRAFQEFGPAGRPNAKYAR